MSLIPDSSPCYSAYVLCTEEGVKKITSIGPLSICDCACTRFKEGFKRSLHRFVESLPIDG